MLGKRKRSDYRTEPFDHDRASGLSFVAYLLGGYLRGADWEPDRPPSSATRQLHVQARTSKGKPSGEPQMRRQFIKWLEGRTPNVPGVKHTQVAKAIARAKVRDPLRMQALEFRQQPNGRTKATTAAWCIERNITPSTLHRWWVKAIALVVEELELLMND